VRYRRTVGQTYPDGTKEVADLLDELGVDPAMGRDAVRKMLRGMGHKVRNGTLSAAIRWRKEARMYLSPTQNPRFGDRQNGTVGDMPSDLGGQVVGTGGDRSTGSVGTGGCVVDTPVPKPVPVDPNDELI